MKTRTLISLSTAAMLLGPAALGQEEVRPRIVRPQTGAAPARPATPSAPQRPAPSQQQVIVAPAATSLDADAVRAIALQAEPPAGLTREERAGLMRVSERLRHKDRAAAEAEWARVVESTVKRDARHKDWTEIEPYTHFVLHEAYVAQDDDLKLRAEKVRFFSAQKRAADTQRAELERAKQQIDRAAPQTGTVTVRRMTLSDTFEPNGRAVTFGEAEPVNAESVADELQRITVLCNRVEEQDRMANVELQNAMKKQQQTLQTMSNVSKMMHDTAMSVIRKIGG